MIPVAMQFVRKGRAVLFGLLTLSVLACAPIIRNHGYVPTPEELAEITVGKDTRDSVIEAVGPPSSTGVLDDSGFFYVSTKVRHYGARDPKIIERQLVAITFTGSGVVQNIERFTLADGQVIALDRRVTSSGVSDKTFLRQLLGNFGRIDPNQLLN